MRNALKRILPLLLALTLLLAAAPSAGAAIPFDETAAGTLSDLPETTVLESAEHATA